MICSNAKKQMEKSSGCKKTNLLEVFHRYCDCLAFSGFTRIMESEKLTSQIMFQFVITWGLGFWGYSEGLKLFLMYNVHSNRTFKSPCNRWSDLKSVQLYLRPTWRCFEYLVHFMFSTLKQVSVLFHLGCFFVSWISGLSYIIMSSMTLLYPL